MPEPQYQGPSDVAIAEYIKRTFDGVETAEAEGFTFFFYGEDRMLPFVTIGVSDVFETVSNLNRPGVFRLNVGVKSETYRSMFGKHPKVNPDGPIDTGYDYAMLDQFMPHPFYSPQSWICVLNPSDQTFEKGRPLLAEAYELAVERQAKREARDS